MSAAPRAVRMALESGLFRSSHGHDIRKHGSDFRFAYLLYFGCHLPLMLPCFHHFTLLSFHVSHFIFSPSIPLSLSVRRQLVPSHPFLPCPSARRLPPPPPEDAGMVLSPPPPHQSGSFPEEARRPNALGRNRLHVPAAFFSLMAPASDQRSGRQLLPNVMRGDG